MSDPKMLLPLTITLVIVAIFLVKACAPKPFLPDEYDGQMIVFGNGGGITGLEEATFISKSGRVVSRVGVGSSFEQLGKLKKEYLSQVQNFITTTDLHNYQYNIPGNAYYFIEIRDKKSEGRIVWERGDEEVNPACKDLYKLLAGLTNQLKNK